jgi:hypothetical protein
MLTFQSRTNVYRRDRLAVNALVVAVLVVWALAVAAHVALLVTQGRWL